LSPSQSKHKYIKDSHKIARRQGFSLKNAEKSGGALRDGLLGESLKEAAEWVIDNKRVSPARVGMQRNAKKLPNKSKTANGFDFLHAFDAG
jgi:hypothetical protein